MLGRPTVPLTQLVAQPCVASVLLAGVSLLCSVTAGAIQQGWLSCGAGLRKMTGTVAQPSERHTGMLGATLCVPHWVWGSPSLPGTPATCGAS